MKKSLFIILAIMLVGEVFAQNGFTNKKEAQNESINGLKQGKWIGYYDANGDNTTPDKAASYGLIVYKDDKICETRRDYYINGKLKQENAYTDGVLNGMSKWYEENGKLSVEMSYADGKEDGVSRWYYENGKIKQETSYSNGKENGESKWYYEHGKLKQETSYFNGKENGVGRWYDENGKLTVELPYANGKENGIGKWYYKNGNVKQETSYSNGVVNGVSKWYYENGDLQSTSITDGTKNAESKTPAKNEESSTETTTTEEATYRGSADPLKGLNVSKAKDMVVGRYYALIIGIDKYKGIFPPLKNAVSDAKAIETGLGKYKFDVFHALYNEQASREKIINEFEWLVANVKEQDNVFIYYSGHGELKKELNKGYWVPVDAATASTSNYISNNDIQTFLTGIKSKHTLLVSDACFSGDIFRGNTVSVPFEESEKYYKEVHGLVSRQAMTSGGIEPVMDGGKDGHSIFAYYFLKGLSENGAKYFDASQLYNKIRIPVINNSEQSPKLSPVKGSGDEGGQFIFIKK